MAPFLAETPNETPAQDEVDAAPSGAPAEPEPSGPAPYQLVRMLTALQDDIARGSGAALRAQRVLAPRIAERLRRASPREWDDLRNARALIIYALSGGRPAPVRAVARSADLPAPYGSLAAGALAYLEGRGNDARRHFSAVDEAALDASLRGSVLMARAALAVEQDPGAALALLHEARVAAPGTLVEEAALRRAILVAAEEDRIDVLDPLVSRYLRKFRRSVYAGNFRKRLAAAITRMSFIEEPAAFVRLERMLQPMTDAGRQELYLNLARAAIETGNRLAAEIAASRVVETAPSGTLDHRRARLYRAAARVVDPEDFSAALDTLRSLPRADLPGDDRAILDAALRLSATVTELPRTRTAAAPPEAAARPEARAEDARPPSAREGQAGSDGPGDVGQESRESPARPIRTEAADRSPFAVASDIEARVEAALAEVDELLKDTR